MEGRINSRRRIFEVEGRRNSRGGTGRRETSKNFYVISCRGFWTGGIIIIIMINVIKSYYTPPDLKSYNRISESSEAIRLL